MAWTKKLVWLALAAAVVSPVGAGGATPDQQVEVGRPAPAPNPAVCDLVA